MSDNSKYSTRPPQMRYCSKCVYPKSSAVPLAFDENGLCSGCKSANERIQVDWDRKKRQFERILEEYKNTDGSNYDCLIPVSGGKDSYYQVHLIKTVYGLNPLLVTYNGNNYTETGMKNLRNMREAFGVDHIFYTPSIETLKKMNRLGLQMMGDMNWHAHSGIFTYPIRVAVQQNIPLMIWGEHGFMDLGGMHSYNDMVEFTYRYRHEHCLRGFEWYDFIDQAPKFDETLEKKELITWMYPSDEEIERVGVRGLFVSNYFKWEANEHGQLMKEKYGFIESEEPFERTYRLMSNLDDMHENGIKDYMKYVKFGYGRATDHVCKDIRAGIMTREEGIEIIRKMDPIKSKDLYRWLDYVGWTEEYFYEVADRFRDPIVWWINEKGEWEKDNIWDGKE
ncbi:MAG: N-acetyl sugar amidotransferase [Fluviicola sp.]